MWARWNILFRMTVILALSCLYLAIVKVDAAPISPKPMENIEGGEIGERGTWYLGESKVESDSKKPPLVFIQGLSVSTKEWWSDLDYHGTNDMYELAHQNGYRTAFVELYNNQMPLDQRENGQLIAKLLKRIYSHFKEKVNIIAHSKGGVDTQTALILFDAYQYVDKVITIGSPHHGTPLIDVYNQWYGKWVFNQLGYKGPGLLAMNTNEMSAFRRKLDEHPNRKKNTYYTASGTSWGPRGSLLWCGGIYLSLYGENDGLIPEESTHLSYARHIFKEEMDHDLLRKGSAVFNHIHRVLREESTVLAAAGK